MVGRSLHNSMVLHGCTLRLFLWPRWHHSHVIRVVCVSISHPMLGRSLPQRPDICRLPLFLAEVNQDQWHLRTITSVAVPDSRCRENRRGVFCPTRSPIHSRTHRFLLLLRWCEAAFAGASVTPRPHHRQQHAEIQARQDRGTGARR